MKYINFKSEIHTHSATIRDIYRFYHTVYKLSTHPHRNRRNFVTYFLREVSKETWTRWSGNVRTHNCAKNG